MNMNLWQLLTGKKNMPDQQGMRTLCVLIMNDNSATCMQGSNMREFNRLMQQWFMNLGSALTQFMMNANRGGTDLTPSYFWNSQMFPSRGTGAVKGWEDSTDGDEWNLWDMSDSSSSAVSDDAAAGSGQEAAWAACEGRDGRGKVRCVRDYLEQQNLQMSSGAGS
jgi:hypothetical protein